MKTVKLISGGIDSYILSQLYTGINLYVDFGQKYADCEMKALNNLHVDYEKIAITSSFQEKNIYIPDRNLMLVTLAEMVYEADVILLAGLKDDNCKDKTPEAFQHMSDVVSEFAGKTVRIESPFWEKTKGQLIEEFYDKDALKNTFSCYSPTADREECGNCPACLRKAIALGTNGVKVKYDLSDEIVKEYLAKIHTYLPDRRERFFAWLKENRSEQWLKENGI